MSKINETDQNKNPAIPLCKYRSPLKIKTAPVAIDNSFLNFVNTNPIPNTTFEIPTNEAKII